MTDAALPNVHFRDADRKDVPAIVALYADYGIGPSREDPSDPLPDGYWRAFDAIAADPRHRLIVGDETGTVVATLQLSFLPHLTHVGTERAHIEAVRVVAERRGEGIGHALLEWAIRQARERGCGMVQLTSNAVRADARRFYESFGFVGSHVGFKLALPNVGRNDAVG